MSVGIERLRELMAEALALAERGRFRVEPNPCVGALVVSSDGEVLGRGFHREYGGPHAEVHALADAGESARGATLVVTLEPCAHDEKKTPPCVAAVREAGIARVVVGSPDPNRATTGRAAAALAAAGIEVEEGVLGEECRLALRHYEAHLARGRPWVIAKWAMSADGRVADAVGRSRWITGAAARDLVHEIRGRVEAIVVGRGTVEVDDPQLTCRRPDGPALARPALRVVLDSRLGVPTTARLLAEPDAAPTLVIATSASDPDRRAVLQAAGVEVAVVAADEDGRVDPRAAWELLHARGVRRVLLESGGRLLGTVLRVSGAQQIMAFTAPVVIGGEPARSPFAGDGWPMSSAPRLLSPRVTAIGDDALLEGYWPALPA